MAFILIQIQPATFMPIIVPQVTLSTMQILPVTQMAAGILGFEIEANELESAMLINM